MSKRIYISDWDLVYDDSLGGMRNKSKVEEVLEQAGIQCSLKQWIPERDSATGVPLGSKFVVTIDLDDHTIFDNVVGIEDITVV